LLYVTKVSVVKRKGEGDHQSPY